MLPSQHHNLPRHKALNRTSAFFGYSFHCCAPLAHSRDDPELSIRRSLAGLNPTTIGDWTLHMSIACSLKLGVMCDTGLLIC